MYPKNNLVKLRLSNRLRQSEVAQILNITTRHYQSLEAGTSDGSIKIWQQLAHRFNTTLDYLLEQDGTQATPRF